MSDNGNPPRHLLLGTVDWQRDDWLHSYYPEDIPPDWRLAYYANDCDCVMLPAQHWRGRDIEAMAEQVDAAPATLRCFVAVEPGDAERVAPLLDALGPARAVILVDREDVSFGPLPHWVAVGGDHWCDRDSDAELVRWAEYGGDLRAARTRAQALNPAVTALVVDGPQAGPADIQALRTLLQLLGRA
ncbi:MAG: hypothetical protein KDI82_14095 [Gammaproteobacteria bacterium]|nr:hypothetical protein [Gammaproteobacteria bacterium]